MRIQLELESIDTITAVPKDYGSNATLELDCTLTPDGVRELKHILLRDIKARALSAGGVSNVKEFIAYIGRVEFARQLSELGYELVLTQAKLKELYVDIDRIKS